MNSARPAPLPAAPGTADRMSFAVFMACALHALILFGIGFGLSDFQTPMTPTLDVVLASDYSKTAPEKADFLGQSNQLGGGDGERATPPRSASQSEMPSAQDLASREAQAGAAPQAAQQRLIQASTAERSSPTRRAQSEVSPDPSPVDSATLVERALAIAALNAELSEERALEARAPRRKLVAASTLASTEAPYFDAWRRRVEQTGRSFFPSGVGIAKELILRADINADGSLREVVILQSSGDPRIDHAARQIVHRAQPFAAFSAAMRAQYDVLQIVRLWRFEPGGSLHTEAR